MQMESFSHYSNELNHSFFFCIPKIIHVKIFILIKEKTNFFSYELLKEMNNF